jgi:hypothetical protein
MLLLLLLLQACALWLVGACGTDLEREQWTNAWGVLLTPLIAPLLLLLLLLLLLQARALWLVGACGTELEREQWIDAWDLSVQHIGARDLVVALQAVQAVLLLAIQILDDQAILDQVCFVLPVVALFLLESVYAVEIVAWGCCWDWACQCSTLGRVIWW